MTVDELYEKLCRIILQGYGKTEVMVYNEVEAPFSITKVEIYPIEPEKSVICFVI